MAEGDVCLLDSNILLRISKSDDLQYFAIGYALHVLGGPSTTGVLFSGKIVPAILRHGGETCPR